jgi:acyl-CoA thioester hydrolase
MDHHSGIGGLERLSAERGVSEDWILYEIRVRYAETDQMGVAYYSNYLVWFEVGRAELCRQKGLAYRDFEKEADAYLAVAEAHCRYHAPALYDEVLVIRTRVQALRKRTIAFEYEIRKKETEVLVASGTTTHVVITRDGRPRSFPPQFVHFFR